MNFFFVKKNKTICIFGQVGINVDKVANVITVEMGENFFIVDFKCVTHGKQETK